MRASACSPAMLALRSGGREGAPYGLEQVAVVRRRPAGGSLGGGMLFIFVHDVARPPARR